MILNPVNYCIPGKHRLLFQTTKQRLSNFKLWNCQKISQMLSNTLRLNFWYYSLSLSTLSSKNNRAYSKQEKKVCLHSWDYMKMKSRSHRHDINSLRSTHIINIRIISVWLDLYVLRNTQATFEVQFMRKLSNAEADLKKKGWL